MKWRVLAGVVLVAVLGWSGWWVVGSQLKQSGFEAWLAARRADGWVAEAAAIDTAGFPNRFDTRISQLQLADPAQGWAWSAPFLDILMLSYQPNAAILALPPGQVVAVPGARARIDAERMRASIRFVPGPSLQLAAFSAEGDDVVLSEDAAQGAPLGGAGTLALHLRALDEANAPENGYALYAEASAVRLPAALRRLIDPTDALAEMADALVIDARLALDAPLDRYAVEQAAPGITHLSFSEASLRWGDLAIAVTGALRADAAGFAEGTIDLRAENWREILAAMVHAGVVRQEMADTLAFGLGFFARDRGGRSELAVPLGFGGGRMRIGPIAIGSAPRLRHP